MFLTFSIAFTVIFSVLCIVLVGVFMRRFADISQEMGHGLVSLSINLFFPCLIFKRCIQTDAFDDLQNLWLPPLIGLTITVLGTLIGLLVTTFPNRWTGLSNTVQKRTFIACVALLNYGYVPIPLIDALFPDDTRMMGALFPMFLGLEISLWTLTLLTMQGKFNKAALRNIINCPILAILIAVPLNVLCHHSEPCRTFFAPLFQYLLNERYGTVSMLANAAIPVALLMIGLTIAELIDVKTVMQRLSSLWKVAVWSCCVRLLVIPVLLITAAVLLPCTLEIKRVIVVYAAMASAILPIALSKRYDGSPETAFDTSMSNTLFSLIASPLWIAVGLHWIG